MTSKMLNKRKKIIIGIVIIIVVTILFVLSQKNKKTVHETVSREMETISSSINDDVMTGVIDYLQQVLPNQESSSIDKEAYNKILETVDKSMKNSLKQKLDGTLTMDDIAALENDISTIVKQCISSMNLDSTKPVKGVDYFTDTEIEHISKTVSTIVETNIEKTLSSDIEGNATSLSVLKAIIESNMNLLKSNLKACQEDIDSLKNKMNDVSGSKLNDLKTQYGSLNTSLNTFKTSVNTIINNLNDEVKANKEQLDKRVTMSISKENGIDTLKITSGVTKE